jgi:hypothetical protein
MIDELHCRLMSVLYHIVCSDTDLIFDNKGNMYIKGRKFKGKKVEKLKFDEKDLEAEINGVKFYRK